jgi:hypothetical protein
VARDAGHEIEFLTPDVHAFGESTHAEFVGVDRNDRSDDDARVTGPRWPRRGAGALIVGLLAVGVVAAEPWADTDDGATPGSTVSPPPALAGSAPNRTASTTDGGERLTPATDPLADVPRSPVGFVVDQLPTDDWVFTGNYSVPEAEALPADPMEIWATPDATRTTGRWVSIRIVENVQHLAASATRTIAGTRPATVVDRSGVAIVRVDDADRGVAYELEGFGLSLEAMLDLAANVEVEGSSLDMGAASGRLEGMRLEVADLQPPWSTASLGKPRAVTNYFDIVGERGVEIALRPADASAATRLLLEPTDQRGTFLLSGDPWQPVALRPVADGLVTVTGYQVDHRSVTAIADSIRRASPDEWTSLIVRTNRGVDTAQTADRRDSRGQRGVLLDGSPWTGVQTPRFAFGGSPRGTWYGEVGPSVVTQVQALSNPRLTVLVATVAWPDPERTLRVTIGDRPMIEVPLEPLGDEPVFGAVFPFTELEPYTYELR